jgi:adenine-specific DNA methylase
MSEFDTKIPTIQKLEINHLNRQIPPEAHTPMYNWHKFWSRKTWNVVGEFIRTYSKEGEIVFDPFGGSGVVAMEALKNKRRVVICDLLPVANEIARLTIKPVSETELFNAFKRVEAKVKNRILDLYKTRCRGVKKNFLLHVQFGKITRWLKFVIKNVLIVEIEKKKKHPLQRVI